MFMDQNITLHARPANVQHGNKRTLTRMVTYLDKLYPKTGKPKDTILWMNSELTHDEFAGLIDIQKQKEYNA